MILFISRKYPPSIGGMQKVSYRLTTEMSLRRPTRVISWGNSQRYLPVFYVIAFVKALRAGLAQRVEVVHVGDAVLASLGLILGQLLRTPIVVTVHGLDVTYPNRLYQTVTPRLLSRFDSIISVSRQTRDECIRRGIPGDRCHVVPNGADLSCPIRLSRDAARERLERRFGINLAGKKVLLTTGRLVARKGVARFVDEIMPSIVVSHPDTFYLVVGSGPQRNTIAAAASRRGLSGSILLAGQVDEETKWEAYLACDLFIMPNVAVEGDLEGFGLVAIEACAAERCVVASDLEGIRDAIYDGENGVLVRDQDPSTMANTIVRLLGDERERVGIGRQARNFVLERFSWSKMVDRYEDIFDNPNKLAPPSYSI